MPIAQNILIVDDNHEDLLLFELLVKSTNQQFGTNIQYDKVLRGEDIIPAICRRNYDFILLDQQMPKLAGRESFELIKHWEVDHKTHIPVVGYSNCNLKEFIDDCLSAGMADFKVKYMQATDLKKLCETIVCL